MKFGKYGWDRKIKRVHIINMKWRSICGTYLSRRNLDVNAIRWINICPYCKKAYGKNLKQDLIVFKLKGK